MQLFSLTSCMIAKVREKVKKFKDYYWGCQSKSFFSKLFSGIWIHRVGVVNSTKFVSGRSAVQSFFLCFSCCSSGANKKNWGNTTQNSEIFFLWFCLKTLTGIWVILCAMHFFYTSNNDDNDQNHRFCNFHCSLASFYDLINKVSFRTTVYMTMMKRFPNWL